jgi:hypothetical protein
MRIPNPKSQIPGTKSQCRSRDLRVGVWRLPRSGYTLLEMIVVMWALAAVLALGGAMLLTALRADQVGAATLRDLTRRTELADQFRADVARAVEAPDRFAEFAAGPACVILRTGGGAHVVYRWHDEAVERAVHAAGKVVRRPLPVGPRYADSRVEFARQPGERTTVTLRIIDAPPFAPARRTDVSATLGGDTR